MYFVSLTSPTARDYFRAIATTETSPPMTVLDSRPYDAAPELDGDLSVADLIFLLESMRFDRRAPLRPLLIDEAVRTYILAAIRNHHSCSH